MKLSRIIVAGGAVMLGIGLALLMSKNVAAGQEDNRGQNNPGYSPGSSAPAPEAVDDMTLREAAKAYVKVRQIVQRKEEDLNSTSDDAAKEQVAEQAKSEKEAAVKSEGLEPEQYNRVLQLVRTDTHLKKKFLSYVKRANKASNKAM